MLRSQLPPQATKILIEVLLQRLCLGSGVDPDAIR